MANMAELSLARETYGSDFLGIWMGQPTRAYNAMEIVRKGGPKSVEQEHKSKRLFSAL